MGTAAECTNCHIPPSIELNLTNAEFIRGASQQPTARVMFVYIIRRLDRSPFCFIQFNPVFIVNGGFIRNTYTLMYFKFIRGAVVLIAECDLKIRNADGLYRKL